MWTQKSIASRPKMKVCVYVCIFAHKGVDLRWQDNGHGIIEDTLTEHQRIEIHVNFQLIENGQNSHCKQFKLVKTHILSWLWIYYY